MKARIRSCFFLLLVFALKLQAQVDHAHADNVLYVKFKDDSGSAVLKNVSLDAAGSWKKVHALPAETLQKLRSDAAKKFKRSIHDPASEYRYYLNDASELEAAKKQLEANSNVEYVLYVPLVFNASAPDYFPFQTYVHPSSGSGINADAVWSTYSNRGAGIKLCDVEYFFNSAHTDLPPVTILGPAPIDPFAGDGSDHGTAVLGEIASLNDGIGTTGLASDCEVYFSGSYTADGLDVGAAITNSLSTLSAGDVLLLEQQMAGPNYTGSADQAGLIPVEWYQPTYDAIVLAIGQGITVIEAAGNGGEDLDDPVYSIDNGGHYPFLPGNGSGAIIIGAGGVGILYTGSAAPRSRLWYSNYGSCVHLQGNGEAVYTTGYGFLFAADGADSYYTDNFGGTSGASPIVAGAAILLQSVYKAATGSFLAPADVETYLISSGQPQQNGSGSPVSKHIGPLPDIYVAVQDALVHAGITENKEENSIAVYPNPGNGNFTIAFADRQTTRLKITNAIGQTVKELQTPAAGNTLALDLSDQPQGVYFVECYTATSRIVKKIIIQ